MGEISLKSDSTQGTTGRVGPVEKWLGRAQQVREKAVGVPFTIGAGNVHCRGGELNRLAVGILLRTDQTSVLLSHVLLHLLIIGVLLLSDWSVDIAQVLSAHEIEFSFPFNDLPVKEVHIHLEKYSLLL